MDLRIQLSKLAVYCRVVELESVTKTAKEMYLSQPVVTAHVRTLQDRLGVQLLYRDGHSMRTTEEGRLIYEWAKDVLTRSQEMARRIDGMADGSVGAAAIAASMTIGSYLLPDLLSRFVAERPSARIGMDMFDPEHVIASVESGEYDFGVLILKDPPSTSALTFEEIGEEEFVLIANVESTLPERVAKSEVAELQFVASPENRVRTHLLNELLREKGIERGPAAIELGHAEAMKRVLKATEAVSFLFSSSVEDELARGELRRIAIDGAERLPAPIVLAYRDSRGFSALQRDLVDSIRHGIAPALPLAAASGA
ncbi:MAG: LysR family transcriptional regulator [Actinobacteria bacterium]|nr:LysR family transcriptional regulator [Actinomycetota bacterium]